MTDRDSFLAAIRAAPHDDALQQVYADWLEEQGDPEAARWRKLGTLATVLVMRGKLFLSRIIVEMGRYSASEVVLLMFPGCNALVWYFMSPGQRAPTASTSIIVPEENLLILKMDGRAEGYIETVIGADYPESPSGLWVGHYEFEPGLPAWEVRFENGEPRTFLATDSPRCPPRRRRTKLPQRQ